MGQHYGLGLFGAGFLQQGAVYVVRGQFNVHEPTGTAPYWMMGVTVVGKPAATVIRPRALFAVRQAWAR
jgi:hypothetical protein